MSTPQHPTQTQARPASSRATLVAGWTLVVLPIGYGLATTVLRAIQLFG